MRVNFTRRIRDALISVLVPGIVACAAPVTSPEPYTLQHARRLEARIDAQTISVSPTRAITDLRQALHLYSLADDLEGQVRCHLKLIRIYISLEQTDTAMQYLQSAKSIANTLQLPEYLYGSYLLEARLSGKKSDFETALKWSTSSIQRAVVLTYLSRVDEGYRLIVSKMDQAEDSPEDFAFVLYEYARKQRHVGAGGNALVLFKQIDHHLGVRNTLHLLAKIYKENGRLELAKQYFQRARVVSISLNDTARTRIIEAELDRF